MIEARGLSGRTSSNTSRTDDLLAALADEMATFRGSLPKLLQEQEGRYVLIQGKYIVGIFPDRSAALQEGYQRFGVVPFLARQIAAAEPTVYLPNVAP